MTRRTDVDRENARRTDGKFGEQHLADPGPDVLAMGEGDLWARIADREQTACTAMHVAKQEAQRRITEWTRVDLAKELVIQKLPPGSVIPLARCDWFANREANDPDRDWVAVDKVYASAEDWYAQQAGHEPEQPITEMGYASEVRIEPFGSVEGDEQIVDFDGFTVDGDRWLLSTDKVLAWLNREIATPKTVPPAL